MINSLGKVSRLALISLFAFGLLTGGTSARAGIKAASTQEQVLAIETDAFEGFTYLDVVRAVDGSVTSMVVRERDGTTRSFSLEQLRANAVVREMDGHEVLFLKVEQDFDANKGGHAVLRFLRNGITGSYRSFRILIDLQKTIVLRSDPSRADPESDRNSYTSVFNYIFMRKNTLFGATIGIDKILPAQH